MHFSRTTSGRNKPISSPEPVRSRGTVNGGEISGRWGGVKPGQLGEIADMQRGPIGPLCMSAAKMFRRPMSGKISPVSGSMVARRRAEALFGVAPSIA